MNVSYYPSFIYGLLSSMWLGLVIAVIAAISLMCLVYYMVTASTKHCTPALPLYAPGGGITRTGKGNVVYWVGAVEEGRYYYLPSPAPSEAVDLVLEKIGAYPVRLGTTQSQEVQVARAALLK